MKTIYPILCTILIALAIGSCSDDTTVVTGPVVASAGTMTALLNGARFTSDSSQVNSFADYSRSSKLLSIFGRKGQTEELSVTVYSFNGVGAYTLGDQQAQGLGSYVFFDMADSTQTRTYGTSREKSGTLTISKFDTAAAVVSGSFKFNGIQLRPAGTTNTMTVLDGSFTNLPLTIR